MNRPLATAPSISDEVLDAVENVWACLRIDDAQLRDPATQETLFRRCVAALGLTWTQLVSNVETVIRQPPHRVVLRTPGQRPSPALLAALGVALGRLCDPYSASWSRVLQEIPHKPNWTPDLEWHTDSTGWPTPNDVTALTCLKSAPAGGATDLLALDTVIESCGGYDSELVTSLSESRFAWPLDTELGGGHSRDWIIQPHRTIRFMRAALLAATDARLKETVRHFAETIDALPADFSAVLDLGDILLFDNRRCLHRRGELDDPGRQRLLLRTKLIWHTHKVGGHAAAGQS